MNTTLRTLSAALAAALISPSVFAASATLPGIDFHGYCGEVIIYAWMDRRRENSEKPYGTRLGAGQAVSARLVGK